MTRRHSQRGVDYNPYSSMYGGYDPFSSFGSGYDYSMYPGGSHRSSYPSWGGGSFPMLGGSRYGRSGYSSPYENLYEGGRRRGGFGMFGRHHHEYGPSHSSSWRKKQMHSPFHRRAPSRFGSLGRSRYGDLGSRYMPYGGRFEGGYDDDMWDDEEDYGRFMDGRESPFRGWGGGYGGYGGHGGYGGYQQSGLGGLGGMGMLGGHRSLMNSFY
ncbi:hypothetical protein K402DRAFT_399421 [Aulographum hederae CBS 113979]|uniref:Uncharacterized protein n=1 Tax=Aulographum hederae CBS 113979 TaxID=1176131 RepID=A0A6G1HH70_9PEZI|nr:hypothetical protein K402DRAFT_399421 [Aulographum hederae CBS 113979]